MVVKFEKKIPKAKKAPDTTASVLGFNLRSPENILTKLSKEQYCKLQNFLQDMILLGRVIPAGDKRESLEGLIQEYNGRVKYSATDKLLDDEYKEGYPTAPPPTNLTTAKAHVESAVAYLGSTITVEDGIWSANSDPTKASYANAIADRLKLDAQTFSHSAALTAAFRHGLVSNLGGVFVDWTEDAVQEIQESPNGMEISSSLRSGNKLVPTDIFNLILDQRVTPDKMYCEGEYAGYVKMMTRSAIFDKLRLGVWALPEGEDYDPYNFPITSGDCSDYYTPPSSADTTISGDSVITLYVRIYPKLFGLSDSTEPSVWRFTILRSAHWVVGAEDTESSYLPVCMFQFDPETNYNTIGSLASQLISCQRFISFVFSAYQRSLLKNIAGGVVGVSSDVFDIQKMSHAAALGGVVPATRQVPDRPLSQDVVPLSSPVNLTNIPQDINLALEMMQRIFPTDMLKQIASLERATQYQAAATVQAGNKRNVLVAASIDTQMMAPLRQIMVDNLLRHVTSLEVVDDKDGKRYDADISNFIGLNLRYVIADGMAGIDKLGVAEALQQAIYNMLQMPQVLQNFDVYGAINYVLRLRGSNIDFNQFKANPAAPAVAPTPDVQDAQQTQAALPTPEQGPAMSPEAILMEQLGGMPQQ